MQSDISTEYSARLCGKIFLFFFFSRSYTLSIGRVARPSISYSRGVDYLSKSFYRFDIQSQPSFLRIDGFFLFDLEFLLIFNNSTKKKFFFCDMSILYYWFLTWWNFSLWKRSAFFNAELDQITNSSIPFFQVDVRFFYMFTFLELTRS